MSIAVHGSALARFGRPVMLTVASLLLVFYLLAPMAWLVSMTSDVLPVIVA